MRYKVPYQCSNCFHAARVSYPRGRGAMNYFECPECGMNSFNKKQLNFVPSLVYFCDDGVTLVRESEVK